MSRLPLVAIIGRPNTGKSTLFNRIVRKRVAIESPVAGTTRDHILRKVTSPTMDYLLVDTGGMGGGTADKDFEKDVHAQSTLALAAADVIIFTVDGRAELTKSDHQIAEMLRKQRRRHVPVILAITKCDTPKSAEEAKDAFHELGIAEDIVTVSAAHNIGTDDLREIIIRQLEKLHFEKETVTEKSTKEKEGNEEHEEHEEHEAQVASEFNAARAPRIAIVGRPNVGKSSLINALMSDTQRKVSPKLVSQIPGTTRDATDTIIRHEDQEFILVDTAGLRRKARIEQDLEGLSVLRTLQAIEDCDVAVLLIDAHETVSNQDKKIAGTVIDAGKGLIILVNKIDLMKGEERSEKMLEAKGAFPFCKFAPMIPCSTITRENLLKIFPLALMIHRNMHRRIAPRELSQFLRDVIAGHPMTALKSCKHVTQAKDAPPTFVLFVRNPKTIQLSQLRYLENRLRERVGLEGVPVKWVTKGPNAR